MLSGSLFHWSAVSVACRSVIACSPSLRASTVFPDIFAKITAGSGARPAPSRMSAISPVSWSIFGSSESESDFNLAVCCGVSASLSESLAPMTVRNGFGTSRAMRALYSSRVGGTPFCPPKIWRICCCDGSCPSAKRPCSPTWKGTRKALFAPDGTPKCSFTW